MASNLLDVSHFLMRIWVDILLQKVEEEVCVEEYLNSLIPSQMELVIWLLKRDIEQRCEARVTDKKENEHIKVTLPGTVGTNDDLVLPGAFLADLSLITFTVILRFAIILLILLLLLLDLGFGLFIVSIVSLKEALGWPPSENCALLSVLK